MGAICLVPIAVEQRVVVAVVLAIVAAAVVLFSYFS